MIVAGCVAQAENEEMLKREPYIDLLLVHSHIIKLIKY